MSALESNFPLLRVIVRGWLNCNQVLLLSNTENVVIDTGYSTCAEETLRLLALPENLGDRPLTRVINTHCHADHVGGNAALLRRYGCNVTIPAGDAGDVRQWNRKAFLMDYADQHIEQFDYTDTLAAGDEFTAAGMRWRALPAPGHDMNALVFWCEAQRIVITGDALWQNGVGAMFPQPSLESAIYAAHATLDRIAALAPCRAIPGHGNPFTDVMAAIDRGRHRLDGFARDPAKNAWHVSKSLFSFALLAKRRMRLADIAAYIESVPAYRDLNERFIGISMEEMTNQLVRQLISAKVAVADGAFLTPTLTA